MYIIRMIFQKYMKKKTYRMCLICSVLIIIVPFRREKIKTYSKSGVYLLTSN